MWSEERVAYSANPVHMWLSLELHTTAFGKLRSNQQWMKLLRNPNSRTPCSHYTKHFQAISVCGLVKQVSKLCPNGSPISSLQWNHLQFCPKNSHTKEDAQFHIMIPVKMINPAISVQAQSCRCTLLCSHFRIAQGVCTPCLWSSSDGLFWW